MAEATYHRGDMEISEQELTYRKAMDFSKFYGIPATLGIVGLVTGFLLGWGILGAIAAMIVLFVAPSVVARAFFSH